MRFQIYELSDNKLIIPMAISNVKAGFPSPAEGYEEERIYLADILVTNKASTYCVRVKGNSMVEANIFPVDVLVVDKSLEATHGKIVIAVVDGEFTVKTPFSKDFLVKLILYKLNIYNILLYVINIIYLRK